MCTAKQTPFASLKNERIAGKIDFCEHQGISSMRRTLMLRIRFKTNSMKKDKARQSIDPAKSRILTVFDDVPLLWKM